MTEWTFRLNTPEERIARYSAMKDSYDKLTERRILDIVANPDITDKAERIGQALRAGQNMRSRLEAAIRVNQDKIAQRQPIVTERPISLVCVQVLDSDIPDIKYDARSRDSRDRAYQNVPDGTYMVLLSNSGIRLTPRMMVKRGQSVAFPPFGYWMRNLDIYV